jgi:hypothetical protein
MRHQPLVRLDDVAEQPGFIFGSATHSETRRAEANMRTDASFGAGSGYTFTDGADEFQAGFFCRNMVARAGTSPPHYTSSCISDERLGCGLSTIYAEKEFRVRSQLSGYNEYHVEAPDFAETTLVRLHGFYAYAHQRLSSTHCTLSN